MENEQHFGRRRLCRRWSGAVFGDPADRRPDLPIAGPLFPSPPGEGGWGYGPLAAVRQLFPEVGDRLRQSGIERRPRRPAEELTCAGQVGTALFWIIFGERIEDDISRAAAQVT